MRRRFRQKVKNVDMTVYESNGGVGGTWFANRYPVSDLQHHISAMFTVAYQKGLACDIPSHCVSSHNHRYQMSEIIADTLFLVYSTN